MHKLAIGKRHEFVIWARLLQEGFDVFPALVDDKGIDGIVGFEGKYKEVQIKSGKNWTNQRGLSVEALSRNVERIFLIYDYTKDEVRFFTANEILSEKEWQECIRWDIPQIKLNKEMLKKYQSHDWEGFANYLRGTRLNKAKQSGR